MKKPLDSSFEMVRLQKSKQAVDVSPNCIRNYARRGLRLYKVGKAVFFSRTELEAFIRANATPASVSQTLAA